MSNQNQTTNAPRPPRRHRPSLFWPVVLIVSGILLLLSNLGYLPEPSWSLLWRLWPVILIALGLDVLIGRRSLAGAIISGILIFLLIGGVVGAVFFARNIPLLADWARGPTLEQEFVSHPLNDIEQATVSIDFTTQQGELTALDDSSHLIEGDIDYYGDLISDVTPDNGAVAVELVSVRSTPLFNTSFGGARSGTWDVALHPSAAYDLDLKGGSGRLTLDLSELTLTGFRFDQGSGATELSLPSAGTFSGQIDGGSGGLYIVLPEEMEIRIFLDGGSGAFRTDEHFTLVSGEPDDGIWESENYDAADNRIELDIDQGSGAIRIER